MYLAGSMRPWPEGQAWIREQNYDAFVHSFENYLAERCVQRLSVGC